MIETFPVHRRIVPDLLFPGASPGEPGKTLLPVGLLRLAMIDRRAQRRDMAAGDTGGDARHQ